MKTILILIASFFISTTAFASTPSEVISSSVSEALLSIDKELTSGSLTKKGSLALIEKHVMPNVDVSGMAKSVIGRSWRDFDDAKKATFEKNFRKLVASTWSAVLLAKASPGTTFKAIREEVSSSDASVKGTFNIPTGKPINVVFSLTLLDNKWKASDLAVEGVSLTEAWRSEFRQILSRDGFDALINILETKLSRAEK